MENAKMGTDEVINSRRILLHRPRANSTREIQRVFVADTA